MSPRGRALALALLGGHLLLGGACVRYHPEPLPESSTLAAPAEPDTDKLRLAAAELEHPRLQPLAIDLADGLSPDEAAILAVLVNPDLAAARTEHDETAAQLVAAGLLPRPTVSFEADRPYGAGSDGTVVATNAGVELDVSALVRRSARVAEATARRDRVDLGIAWQEWQVAQSARLQALRIGWLDRRIALADGELDSWKRTLEALSTAMNAGDVIVSDVGVQMAAVDGLRRSRDELHGSLVEARNELGRLLGSTAVAELPIVGDEDVAARSVCPDVDTRVSAALAARLDLLALRRGYDAQEANVRAAVLSQLPGVSVGVVHQRNESALKFLGGFVSLGLPFLGHARAEISLEQATRARLRAEFEARAAGVRADVRSLCSVLAELNDRIGRVGASVERLRPVAESEDAAALRGDVDRLAAQTVRGALSDARLELEALHQARAETRVGLETAIGRPLVSDSGGSPGGTR